MMNDIRRLIQKYVDQNKIAGANIIVRKNNSIILDYKYGYQDISNKTRINDDTIYRLASMTKPITAIAVMILIQENKLNLDDYLEDILPEFKNMYVLDADKTSQFYHADPNNPFVQQLAEKQTVSNKRIAKNKIKIKNLLNHTSGLGQGEDSIKYLEANLNSSMTLAQRVKVISTSILDFEPGTKTGYSATTAYDVLGYLIEKISNMNLAQFIKQKILVPLKIKNMAFVLNEKQLVNLSKLYEARNGKLIDVSETEKLWLFVNADKVNYYSGSAGLLGSVKAYDRIVQMLSNKGELDGVRLLSEKSVSQMTSPYLNSTLEMAPGIIWGLGMTIVKEPESTERFLESGSFGWSGAYGTHFYIDPKNNVTVTLGVSCSNIGGANSQLSFDIEKAVYKYLKAVAAS